jgi:hypothetical protein
MAIKDMIPKECKMPDLSKLERLQGTLILRVVFTQADAKVGRKAALFRRVFTRLMDKSITEYQEARTALDLQVQESKCPRKEMQETGRIIYMFSFSDHMENCINSVRRLLRLLERINSDKDAPTIARDKKRFLSSQGKGLIDLRDAFEHMDERIQRDEIGHDEAIMVKLGGSDDRVEIGSHQVTFLELAGIISKLYELASYLVFISDKDKDDVQTVT